MSTLKNGIAATLVSLFVSLPALAADKDPLLDHMVGQWVLTGAIMGQATTHDVKAEWVLQNHYIRLTEVSREKDSSSKPQYDAEVLLGYDPAKRQYVCFWFDTTGIASPNSGGSATRAGETLPFVFKSADGDFRNTMTFDAKADRWSWVMEAEQNGKVSPFAKLTLQRP